MARVLYLPMQTDLDDHSDIDGATAITVTNNNIEKASVWTRRSSGVSNPLYAITYGNGLFVAVGSDGIIITSPDGITWTSRTSGVSNHLTSITYGNSLFVAVGYDGTIITSSDGITWASRTSGVSNHLASITYGNGLFVAVGDRGIIITSPDGITWTRRSSGVSNRLTSITYGNGLFVAVGYGGIIITSSDGITWASRTSGESHPLYAITYGNGLFVAVGSGGIIITSSNGITWTSRTSGVSKRLASITSVNSLFVAVGYDGTIITSSDGITWASRTSGESSDLYAITYDNGLFVAVGVGGTIITSPDTGTIHTQVVQDTQMAAAAQFDGQGYLDALIAMNTTQKSYTICFWMYTSHDGDMAWASNSSNLLNLYFASDQVLLWNAGDGHGNPFKTPSGASYTYTLNQWHHYTVVIHKASKGPDLYVDGIYVASAAYRALNCTQIRISGWYYDANYKCRGRLCLYQIYDTALPSSMIKHIARGLIYRSQWFVRDGRQNLVLNGLDTGVLGGSRTPTLGPEGDSPRGHIAWRFASASRQYCYIPKQFMLTGPFTVSLWAKNDNWQQAPRFLSCTENGGWNFMFTENGTIQFLVYANNTYQSAEKTVTFAAGWHHFVGVWTGKQALFFIDGIQRAASTALSSNAPVVYNPNCDRIFIGAEATVDNGWQPSAPYFNGLMADIRMYAKALTADDVKEIYDHSCHIWFPGYVDATWKSCEKPTITKSGIIAAPSENRKQDAFRFRKNNVDLVWRHYDIG